MKKNLLLSLVSIVMLALPASAQFDLSIMHGQYKPDVSYIEDQLRKTRAGTERLQSIKNAGLVLVVYGDPNTNQTWAALYNTSFSTTNPLWNGRCINGQMMEFTIESDRVLDNGEKEIFHCTYVTENGISELTIDPCYTYPGANSHKGNEITFTLDRRPSSVKE